MSKIEVKHLDALARSLRWGPCGKMGRYAADAYIDETGSLEMVFTDPIISRTAFTVELSGPEWLDMHIMCHGAYSYQLDVETSVSIMRQLEGAINLMMEMDDV